MPHLRVHITAAFIALAVALALASLPMIQPWTG